MSRIPLGPVPHRIAAAAILMTLTTHDAAAQAPAGDGTLRYPVARKSDQADTFFGTTVADPYRWLEVVDSSETQQWIASENAVTHQYLDGIAERGRIKDRLTALWNYPKYGLPTKRGDQYFSTENSGLQNQAPLYVQTGRQGTKRLLLDPNTLSADGTVALSSWNVTEDGRLLGYGVAIAGSDWEELRVRDVATGRDLPDTLHWAKFTTIAWTKDGRGFFYARFPEPTSGNALIARSAGQKLYYHRLGSPQSSDRLIWERPDQPEWYIEAEVTDDGRYAILRASQGTDPRNRLYYIDLGDPLQPAIDHPVVAVVDAFEAEFVFAGNGPRTLYLRTDLDAPMGRVIRVDLDHPDRAGWHTVVASTRDKLEDAQVIGGHIVASYLHDAQSRLAVYTLDGTLGGTVALPGIGTVAGVSGRQDDPEAFYDFTSFLQPASIYRVDVRTRASEATRVPTLPTDVSQFETHQVFCRSRDGTRVPVFVTARRGIPLDGTNPAWLYAYGGFNISMTPAFSPKTLAWLELGGVYAVAVLRGGGEYGKAWHEAGMFERKQNVFDDFIASAQCLVSRGYTSASRLAIEGGSNGGLLVGAAMTQRPALFAVALPAVGVMDMLRYQKFTLGWGWKVEYGSADDSTQFRYLIKYSPLHNIHPGTHYPATLVMTSDHDDRVVPGHSFKFAAALQAAQAGSAPVLIRIETRAGHGAGKPTSKQIDLAADEIAFTVKNLGLSGRAL